ncbi:MAG: SDR family NAD(P)-dependent oxidoreductase [Proteobacteria bacterium]|nr:SDR family NAD(P)-dependent oxidoreductase [Pseudomonadota bacterium]
MSGICDGRVVIVTGAGRGIGRTHALEFARQGARVVVNDVGGGDESPANDVVAEIKALGAEAVANNDDISTWAGAENLVKTAVTEFGKLDVLVNNAGIIRDRSLVKMTEDEWDSVIRVHLKGTFAPSHFAALYWKEISAAGKPADARIINTTSASGLYGNQGQTNYGSAKAGIASFTITAAMELKKFGVTVNAIAPGALTRMTAPLGMDKLAEKAAAKGFDFTDPANIAPLVVWLASAESKDISGRVFEIFGGRINVCDGWRQGAKIDKNARWDVSELNDVIHSLLAKS